jgi:hypothetical protein
MKIITAKSSETGKRFQELLDKRTTSFQHCKEMAEKYGFQKFSCYGHPYFTYKIGACLDFKEPPDPKVWSIKKSGCTPKGNSALGKQIIADFNAAPRVFNWEVFEQVFNMPDMKISCQLGFDSSNPEFFGFSARDEWDMKLPADCREVTVYEYNLIMGIAEAAPAQK